MKHSESPTRRHVLSIHAHVVPEFDGTGITVVASFESPEAMPPTVLAMGAQAIQVAVSYFLAEAEEIPAPSGPTVVMNPHYTLAYLDDKANTTVGIAGRFWAQAAEHARAAMQAEGV